MRRSLVVIVCLALGMLGVATLSAPVSADTDPPASLPSTVSAVPLPTVQLNGVGWSQAVIGNTVYVGGEFTSARPAGSAAGQNETPRSNLLAYNLTTGKLITAWNPAANGAVLVVRASPDGSRLYVGGNFTTIDGKTRNRVAALDPSTGEVIAGFAPNVNAEVRSLAVTDNTVYLGGFFTQVSQVDRLRLAAVRASDGALTTWAPQASGSVDALALSPDGTQVLAGGRFTTLNGSSNPGYGLGALDASDGSLLPWAANGAGQVRNAGDKAGITSLVSRGDSVYASGFDFGGGGTLEGVAKMSWDGGTLQWLEDCHGDTYDTYALPNLVYGVGHAHYCGNLPGGFPQPGGTWTFYRALAFTSATTQTLMPDYYGYANHAGQPAPTLLHFFPRIDAGTYTGQGQGAWSVVGSGDYVAMAGEFPRVGSLQQEGLVRFVKTSVNPATSGSEQTSAELTPTLRGVGAGQVLVSWPTAWDRDNARLTYQVIRGTDVAHPVTTRTVSSFDSDRPFESFVDSGLDPGSTVSYRVFVTDGTGNEKRSSSASVVVPESGSISDYARVVSEDGPMHYWRFSEASGSTVADYPNRGDGTLMGSVTRDVPGIRPDDPAATFDGSTNATMYSAGDATPAPYKYSVEAWFSTTSPTGGKIVGYGNAQTGDSTNNLYDRQIYLDATGHVNFGSRQNNSRNVVTSPSGGYNDGAWHHVVGTTSDAGMKLYLDGQLVAQNAGVRVGHWYPGWWRIGGDTLANWANNPPTDYFTGSIDEVAVYVRALSAQQVAEHFAVGTGHPVNKEPVATFSANSHDLSVDVDGRASSDEDGSITSYSWDWGDGTTPGSGETASHTYAASGSYAVTLTVTDDAGATDTTTKQVSATDPVVPAAADQFDRTVSGGWGTADTGGAWSASGKGRRSVGGGTGALRLGKGQSGWERLVVSSADVDGTVDFTLDKRPGRGGVQVAAAARSTSKGEYRFRVSMRPDKTVSLSVSKVVGTRETRIGRARTVPTRSAPGRMLRLRFQVGGAGTATLRATLWRAGAAEPAPQVVRTDATRRLRAPGGVGLFGRVGPRAANAPVTLRFDNLEVDDLS